MHKIGIVGCGGIGNHHAGFLAATDQGRVVAVCDIIEERARAMGERLGARCCTDFHDLLDDVDVVWDCTPPFARPEVVTDCVRAGKHMFSEKPFALDLETADRMLGEVEASGVTFMVDYVLRFTDPYRIAHDIFRTGNLGRLVSIYTRRYMPMDARGTWYGEQDRSGGIALDFASHDLDLQRWFGGEPRTVFGRVDRVRDGAQSDEHAQAMLAFEQGMGNTDVSWCSPAGTSTFGVVGARGSIIADGSGTLRKRIDGEDEEIIDANAAMEVDPEGNIGGNGGNPAPRGETVYEHFFRCLDEGLTPLTNAREARNTLGLVLAVKESASTGKSVQLE
jgi:UDP-N-acetylglucosamine 3-dehydrogenase